MAQQSSKLPERVQELLDELYNSANRTNKKRVDELARTLHSSMVPAVQGGVMNVESMVASKTKNPMVIFSWNDNRGELSPVQARGYAMRKLWKRPRLPPRMLPCTIDMHLSESDAFALITGVRNNRRKFENE